jgi:hypothetical protein
MAVPAKLVKDASTTTVTKKLSNNSAIFITESFKFRTYKLQNLAPENEETQGILMAGCYFSGAGYLMTE